MKSSQIFASQNKKYGSLLSNDLQHGSNWRNFASYNDFIYIIAYCVSNPSLMHVLFKTIDNRNVLCFLDSFLIYVQMKYFWNRVDEKCIQMTTYYLEYSDYWPHLYCYHIYPTPPLGQDMTQGQFLSGV